MQSPKIPTALVATYIPESRKPATYLKKYWPEISLRSARYWSSKIKKEMAAKGLKDPHVTLWFNRMASIVMEED